MGLGKKENVINNIATDIIPLRGYFTYNTLNLPNSKNSYKKTLLQNNGNRNLDSSPLSLQNPPPQFPPFTV